MDRSPRITVIVPVYDDAAQLASCLGALAAQDVDEPVEILVVDNGSHDDPAGVVAGHAGARLLTELRPGSYAARNRAVREARGEVLAFTDADCVPAGGWLRAGLTVLAARPDAAVVAGRVDVTTADPRATTTAELYDLVHAFPVERYVRDFGFGVTANLFTRRSVVDSVGPFDERLRSGGDAEWCQRARRAGQSIVYAPQAVVRHPARRRTVDVLRKARRVTWGREDLRDRLEGRQRDVFRELRRAKGRTIRDVRATWSHPRLGSTAGRVRVAGLACLVQGVAALETARYRRAQRRDVAAPRS